ncbi:DJ-1/YajL/PfpI superfamily, includes chaperone protein YajL (former ThiJ), parkinsonism-associated protein DJ-1, peptidases PfpI, Hsp31 [hydrothermal vent metagenome]|uniref:DJ-1/YajL/PfpI superfamily, includes chaperone protein YajL (Former ThiJ), parkinsonism-associated protein DJ-1, peptidases PfpI, Hsp31 n=1 Tax=hydrothermal vent metagenome TaxID=652676 RepID=A0A3B0Y449_9ZZZZ
MSHVLVPLAEGFEELEAITITDLLVRAKIKVTTAGLENGSVKASRGATLIPMENIENLLNNTFDMIVLPGGLPGANYLRDSQAVQSIIKNHAGKNKYIAAICAAPRALAQAGLLKNKTVTCYPGSLDGVNLPNTKIKNSVVEIDGNIITSRGPGTAMDFALTLIELLEGREVRAEVEKGLAR